MNGDVVHSIELLSVNRATAQPVDAAKPQKLSGIFKVPVNGAVLVDTLGVVGDAVVNKKHHGGPGQAIYIYSKSDYAYWAAEHAIAVVPGLFGENLTLAGFESAELRAGDRIELGDLVIEITAPRIPCATLTARMGNPQFARIFRAAARPGAYARVLKAGSLEAGETGRLVRGSLEGPTLGEQFALYFEPEPSRKAVEALLALPVAERERAHYEAVLERLNRR